MADHPWFTTGKLRYDDILKTLPPLLGGDRTWELTEQIMTCMIVSPDDNVLELGSNIGRVSTIVSKILSSGTGILHMIEPDSSHIQILKENVKATGMTQDRFFVFEGALATQQVFTFPNPGWIYCKNSIEWTEYRNKYCSVPFDVLICDCEGGLYTIVKQDRNFLDQFNRILLENDFHDVNEKEYVHALLTQKGFRVVFQKELLDDPRTDFFQLWSKR